MTRDKRNPSSKATFKFDQPANPTKLSKEEASATVKEAGVKFKPLDEEHADYLVRNAEKAYGIQPNDTAIEFEKRNKYNESLCSLTWAKIYEQLGLQNDYVLVKLFMKPIVTNKGVLIPDVIKTRTEGGTNFNYEPNRFPYLACAVVVNASQKKRFNEMFGTGGTAPEVTFNTQLEKYSFVTLTNDFVPMKNVFFLNKSNPDPKNYEGFALVHQRQIETVLSKELVEQLGGYNETFKLFSQPLTETPTEQVEASEVVPVETNL